MVNLRGGLRGLGVALTTLGTKGIEEQQRADQDRRLLNREMAFATFQSGVRTREAEAALDRSVTEKKVMAPHVAAQEAATLTEREPFAERAQERTVAARREERAADNAEWTRRNQVEFDTWRRRHGIEEDTTRSRELWRREQGLDPSSTPQRYLENADTGTFTAIYRDGTSEDTGVAFVNEDTSGEQVPRRPGAASPRSRSSRDYGGAAREVFGGSRPSGTLSPRGEIARPRTPEEVERLPRGTRYMSPDGRMFTRN